MELQVEQSIGDVNISLSQISNSKPSVKGTRCLGSGELVYESLKLFGIKCINC